MPIGPRFGVHLYPWRYRRLAASRKYLRACVETGWQPKISVSDILSLPWMSFRFTRIGFFAGRDDASGFSR